MKYKLLSVGKCKEYNFVNIGDYIQTLAASQFLPRIDGFIDRDMELGKEAEKSAVIMNGWFMYKSENWPPSASIYPLFVAFHMNTKVRDKMTCPNNISYFKNHEPIGCRDRNTADYLMKLGIKAYFSGCLTLTLGLKYKSTYRKENVIIVDPTTHINWNMKSLLYYTTQIPLNYKKIAILLRKKILTRFPMIIRMLYISAYYKNYSKLFTDDTILEAEYIEHQSIYYKKRLQNEQARLDEAERLVRKYSSAGMVVSSRIHCALPCLGLETPVIFVENKDQNELSASRLKGLSQLFNCLDYKNGVITPNFSVNSKLSVNNCPKNKDSWKELAFPLINRCNTFIKELNNS